MMLLNVCVREYCVTHSFAEAVDTNKYERCEIPPRGIEQCTNNTLNTRLQKREQCMTLYL